MARLMPEGWNCGDECLLNGLYTWAQEHKAQVPGRHPGPRGAGDPRGGRGASAGSTSSTSCWSTCAASAAWSTRSAASTSTCKKRTPIGGGTSRISGWIEPGVQHLDGYHALWYARSRQGSTNYERMARQRCVMTAMVRAGRPAVAGAELPEIAGATTGVIQTDLPQSELGQVRRPGHEDPLAEDQERQLRPAAHQAVGLRPRRHHGPPCSDDQGLREGREHGGVLATGKAAPPAGGSTAGEGPRSPETKPSPPPDPAVRDAEAPAHADTADLGGICSAG